ncbi:MAG: hypothetical protein ACK6CT_06725 [Planctomycetia bacterium]|jgi:hypothetical protein
MGGTRAVIHVEPTIAWQAAFVPVLVEGLRTIGVPYTVTRSRERMGPGIPILLGTSCWRSVERDGPYLLLDRCSFGSPAEWMSIVMNGHGRRGDHRVPEVRDGSRWERHAVEVRPWCTTGSRTILCGQTETYSPHFAACDQWYARAALRCSHFRPHPAAAAPAASDCPAALLPRTRSWEDCRLAVTLNSSVAIDTVLAGIPTLTMDEAAMAWDVTGHEPDEIVTPDRSEWLHWLAWTQWTHDEIKEGTPWPRFL